jgi:hypothetical protein
MCRDLPSSISPKTPRGGETTSTLLSPRTEDDSQMVAATKYKKLLVDVMALVNQEVDGIIRRIAPPLAPNIRSASYIWEVRESAFRFADTILHGLNTFIYTVMQRDIEPLHDVPTSRIVVTGELVAFVASRITGEVARALSSTRSCVQDNIFWYPVFGEDGRPTMMTITVSDDSRFNGHGDVVLLVNVDENEPPSVVRMRERQGWEGSQEQIQELMYAVISVLDQL